MVKVEMLGLIGNNLFQYAVGRILSDHFGYAFEVQHSPYKPKKNIPQLTGLLETFKDAPLALDGQRVEGPLDRTAYLDHDGFDGFRLDLDAMLRDHTPRRFEVKGYFERYEIFRSHKHKLREWFDVAPLSAGHSVGPEDVVAHIRRGDFVTFGRAITLDYYVDLLSQMDFRRLYVCGFGLDPEVKSALRRFSPTYVEGDPVSDFRFMKGFNKIIQSQSTFAWWAGFLSQAEEIYAPLTIPGSTEFEREFPHIDLRVDDESRHNYIVDVPHHQRALGLSDVVRARQHLHLHDLRPLARKWTGRIYKKTLEPLRELVEAVGDPEVGAVHWVRESIRWNVVHRMRRYRSGQYRFENDEGRPLIFGKYRKILVIRINHSYAGFFAYFTFAINQIRFCERNNCLPIVHFGEWSEDGPNAYFDAAAGPNMWDYYFEPLGGHSYEDLQGWIADPDNPITSADVAELKVDDLWYLHLFEPDSVFAYTYGRYTIKRRLDEDWYDHQRRTAHSVVRRHVRVRKHILDKVDAFAREFLNAPYVIGVHLRGTDKGAARGASNTRIKIGPEDYYRRIDPLLEEHPDAVVFVATDQIQYLDEVRKRYGDRIASTDCLRSDGDLAPFQMSEGSPYKKGEEVLIDALLLSRSDFLVKCSSHVGEAALWFNPDIPSVDVNYP